jgi:hypothetical protein
LVAIHTIAKSAGILAKFQLKIKSRKKSNETIYSVFQSAEVQKLWVLGKRQEAKGKRQRGRKTGVPH